MNMFAVIFCNAWLVRVAAVHDLWIELFRRRGYNPKIIPQSASIEQTDVVVRLHLLSIHGLDEVSEKLTTSAHLDIYWFDDFLRWEPADYGTVKVARWPQDDVWKPDLSIKNSVKMYAQLGDSGLFVENFFDGGCFQVIILQFMKTYGRNTSGIKMFETSCAVDTTYFPFDVQTCHLKFTSWSYTKDALNLTTSKDVIDLKEYNPSPQWEILSTSAGTENNDRPETVIYYSIKMKRKPRHLLMTLFLPVILLAVLEVFVFALPSDSGEKSGYAVTVFLAFAVFLSIVNTTMPANSDQVSIFSVYLLIQTIQSTLVTVISLCLIRCASLDETTKVPRILVSLATFPRQCCTRKRYVKRNKINIQKTKVEIISGKESFGKRPEEAETEKETASVEVKQAESFTWKMFANSMDKLCFIVFLSIFVATTFGCFYMLLATPM